MCGVMGFYTRVVCLSDRLNLYSCYIAYSTVILNQNWRFGGFRNVRVAIRQDLHPLVITDTFPLIHDHWRNCWRRWGNIPEIILFISNARKNCNFRISLWEVVVITIKLIHWTFNSHFQFFFLTFWRLYRKPHWNIYPEANHSEKLFGRMKQWNNKKGQEFHFP